jgi:hypothetical protein
MNVRAVRSIQRRVFFNIHDAPCTLCRQMRDRGGRRDLAWVSNTRVRVDEMQEKHARNTATRRAWRGSSEA